MNQINFITKKLQKLVLKRNLKNIEYKTYSDKYNNFYSNKSSNYREDI